MFPIQGLLQMQWLLHVCWPFIYTGGLCGFLKIRGIWKWPQVSYIESLWKLSLLERAILKLLLVRLKRVVWFCLGSQAALGRASLCCIPYNAAPPSQEGNNSLSLGSSLCGLAGCVAVALQWVNCSSAVTCPAWAGCVNVRLGAAEGLLLYQPELLFPDTPQVLPWAAL